MKIKNNIIEIMLAALIILLLIYSSEPIILQDSSRYMNGSLLDPPLYSFLISVMWSLFGNLNTVIVLQTLLIGISIVYFTREIGTIFKLDNLIKIIVSLFLFLPIMKFYNYLLTEPISYAFSIFFVSYVTKLIYNFNVNNLIWTSVFAVALLLTRNQFMFIYPIIVLIFFCIFFQNKSKNKSSILMALSFIGIFIFHNSIIFLNTYLNKHSFNTDYNIVNKNANWTESLTYVSLGPSYFMYIDAIYISNLDDLELFEDQKTRETLNIIFKEMNIRKSLSEFYDGRGHFGKSLVDIRDYSSDLLNNLAEQKNTSINKLKREISIKLILANFKKYIKQIFKKFYDSTWLFVFIPFFILLSGLIGYLKYKSKFYTLIIFISIFVLANHFVVYLFGRVQPRYLIYSDFILIAFIFILFNFAFRNNRNIHE